MHLAMSSTRSAHLIYLDLLFLLGLPCSHLLTELVYASRHEFYTFGPSHLP